MFVSEEKPTSMSACPSFCELLDQSEILGESSLRANEWRGWKVKLNSFNFCITSSQIYTKIEAIHNEP